MKINHLTLHFHLFSVLGIFDHEMLLRILPGNQFIAFFFQSYNCFCIISLFLSLCDQSIYPTCPSKMGLSAQPVLLKLVR